MNIHFLGAAQTVTGSCHLVESGAARFCIDCGMYQGNSAIEARNFDMKNHRPGDLDFVLLTHAHIDHSGLLPRLVREGFKGPIYCTAPTAELVGLMLEDSAHIQETEAAWRRKKQERRSGRGSGGFTEAGGAGEALYTVEDALRVPEQIRIVDYERPFNPCTDVTVCFHDAGHILGSSSLEIAVREQGRATRLVFSGDLGRPGALLMRNPVTPPAPDYLFMESTYGDRDHKNESATLEELAEAIAYSYSRGEKIIIPAFAVERTQEILYCLHLLHNQGKFPADLPVFVDSPLAIRATEVFRKYPDYLEASPEGRADGQPLPSLRYTLDAAESQALNSRSGPAIIISASGMCNAGRIRHHLRHNIWRPGVSIVFVGYQGVGTPGRKIVDGAKSIRLFNEDVAIKARIFTIGGFSAHAGQSQLLDWLGKVQRPGMQVVLVHGEPAAQGVLAERIRQRFGLSVSIPSYLECMEVTGSASPQITEKPAAPRINWALLAEETQGKMQKIQSRIASAQELSWNEQVELRDRILELNSELLSILSQI